MPLHAARTSPLLTVQKQRPAKVSQERKGIYLYPSPGLGGTASQSILAVEQGPHHSGLVSGATQKAGVDSPKQWNRLGCRTKPSPALSRDRNPLEPKAKPGTGRSAWHTG